jgi:hypothetical protein
VAEARAANTAIEQETFLPSRCGGTLHSLDNFQAMVRKERCFCCHYNRLKPALGEEHKYWRVLHALSKIDKSTINLRNPKFLAMMNEIHLDEKWFYMTKDGMCYILAEDEPEPVRRVVHKSHITKVMFLCAQARPRFVHSWGKWWDGKLGIWPVGEYVKAVKSNSRRKAGTLEWKPTNMDASQYLCMLREYLLPAIIAEWPECDLNNPDFTIIVQQDGAKCHFDVNSDPNKETGELYQMWLEALDDHGLLHKVVLYTQPSNSPDTSLKRVL